MSRIPAEELTVDPVRSGVGVFSRRKDLSALAVIFTFGALMNAFGMVSPVYALENWLGAVLHVHREAPVLALIFGAVLLLEPLVLLGAASWITWRVTGRKRSLLTTLTRYSFALVPVGFGMWLAHYSFHFLTGVLTIVPVAQSAVADLGFRFLGSPHWTWTGMPVRFVQPIEMGFLLLGFVGSLMVAWRLAEEDLAGHPVRAFLPWASVGLLLLIASVWLMTLPMDMRATLMSG